MENEIISDIKLKTSYLASIKRKLGLLSSPRIIPFIGYASRSSAFISGLIVEENGISKPVRGQSGWKNIRAMIKRYTANELEGIRVRVSFMGMSKTVITDKYGIYRCEFQLDDSRGGEMWQKTYIDLPEPEFQKFSSGKAEGEVMMISYTPDHGIISDIDDTILVSYATQKLMKLKLMLLNNAYTRMPFEGVSALYSALQKGTGPSCNPIFYVSNSEWNLYDLLHEFIDFHRIPKGPLLLREMAVRVLRPWRIKEVNRNHKTEVIRKLFDMYPAMKFILIGDSGQRDPEIYSDIVEKYPGRVKAVYIRDAGIRDNVARIKALSRSILQNSSSEMILVKDSEAAALHAIDKGFISPGQVRYILEKKEEDVQKKDLPSETVLD